MSSPPSDRSLEGLIADNWGNHALRPDVLALLEPFREHAEYLAMDFDDEEQSWRDYQSSIFGGAIPEEAMAQVAELLEPWEAPPCPELVAAVPPELCVDGKIDEVLTAARLFPGDVLDIESRGLFVRRKTAMGEEVQRLGDVDDWLSLIDACGRWLRADDARWAFSAWNHASIAHTNQLYGREPYTVHLVEVYGVLASIHRAGGALGPAALLHDTVEDTLVTREELEELFGYEVARLVYAVSKDKGPRALTVPASNARIREACNDGNADAATLKLADKIANVRRSRKDRPDLFAMYAAEQPAFEAALEGLGDPRLWTMLREAFGP